MGRLRHHGPTLKPAKTVWFFVFIFAVTLVLRLCHAGVLWVDEDYHLAAGIQTLYGKTLYRDVWYDKPPLNAWLYAAIGGVWGWPLRFFDACYVLAICFVMYRFAGDVWSRREGLFAAALLAFFLNFDLAFAVVPIAPDLFMMLPHIAAVHLAWRKQSFAAGIACGIAFLFNTKALFVVPVCVLLAWRGILWLAAGLAIPNAVAFGILGASGAFGDYVRQVWDWGFAYAKNSPVPNPLMNAIRRTANWLGFHTAIVIPAVWFFRKESRRVHLWIGVWILLSFVAVAVGARFSPRYYFQLLPPLVLDQDSRDAADLVNARAHPGDTLIEWGYRPDVFVYTRLPVASRYWDSQPLTGVPADRHLTGAGSIIPEWAARNRQELTSAKPTFIVDSLSIANPVLAPANYPELRAWLDDYQVVARTKLSLIYERKAR